MGLAEARREALAAAPLRVAVACSPRPGLAVEAALELPAGATAIDAIRASGLLERFGEIDLSTQTVGVWGRSCTLEAALRDGDRVEIYRPLSVDPKEARRRRAAMASAKPVRR